VWNKFAKLGCINLSNKRLKTVTNSRQKSADSDSDKLGKVRGFGSEFGIRNNTKENH